MSEIKNRCGNCLEPYRSHRPRREAAPICPTGGIYRQGTEVELSAAYRAAFGDGPPEPIASFRLDDPASVAHAKAVLSPEALTGFFGPGGGGMAAFVAAIERPRP